MGKSTLLKELTRLLSAIVSPAEPLSSLPGITTSAIAGKQVLMYENRIYPSMSSDSQDCAVIGRFCEEGFCGRPMAPVTEGFFSLGIPALHRAQTSEIPWASIDELGFLETACPAFQDAVRTLLEKKRVIGVIRKQEIPFLTELMHRKDVFLLDLDNPLLSVGCVIMASGISARFGSNKLLADFCGQPLFFRVLELTGGKNSRFLQRIVVTRTPEVEAVCKARNIPAFLHELPLRSDTVRLGLDALLHQSRSFGKPLSGCMFCPSDQPLLRRETLEALCLTFSQNPDRICRPGTKGNPGAPVIFPARLFPELLHLPDGKGGSFLAKKYPEQVLYVPVRDEYELIDADTPETLAKLSRISVQ